MICKSVICRFVIVSDSSVKDEKIYILLTKSDDFFNLVASLAVARWARKTRSAGL